MALAVMAPTRPIKVLHLDAGRSTCQPQNWEALSGSVMVMYSWSVMEWEESNACEPYLLKCQRLLTNTTISDDKLYRVVSQSFLSFLKFQNLLPTKRPWMTMKWNLYLTATAGRVRIPVKGGNIIRDIFNFNWGPSWTIQRKTAMCASPEEYIAMKLDK